jgi:hypothetical protein
MEIERERCPSVENVQAVVDFLACREIQVGIVLLGEPDVQRLFKQAKSVEALKYRPVIRYRARGGDDFRCTLDYDNRDARLGEPESA